MQCPYCEYTDSRVLESRCTEEGQSVRRRRECLRCRHRFTTYERIEFVPITVVKRDGHKESFDRCKLLRGIVRACEKTGINADILDNLVGEIESEIEQRLDRDISSQEIGALVLHHLRSLSEVAYVRFASVYRQFQSIEDFIEILNHLQTLQETPAESLFIASHSSQ
ncbi:transcriptional regulator NrdR [Merismopedia glauca]|uniref:Transcriptional repressor NrdR n=1 Tax=Merismopedia glauca CCAP 1448/3 TaxID=1296344 RepID=A0A2T1C7K6_9CYAN|nr:transcriptional regulator NrdR [Merismopedia glauca]PSB04214.1 transcriptional regulator NrdR [Merismopedia glauca CCAP 1448/3]